MTGLANLIPSAAQRATRALHTVAQRLLSPLAHLRGPDDTRVLDQDRLVQMRWECTLRAGVSGCSNQEDRMTTRTVPQPRRVLPSFIQEKCSRKRMYEVDAMAANPSGTSSAVGTVLNDTKKPRSSVSQVSEMARAFLVMFAGRDEKCGSEQTRHMIPGLQRVTSTSEEETSMRVPRTTQMNHRTMRARPDNAKQTGEILEKFAESAGGRDGGSHMRLPVGARAPWHASVCARAPAILNISRSLVGRCPFCPALCVRTRRTHGTQSHSVQISEFWICFTH